MEKGTGMDSVQAPVVVLAMKSLCRESVHQCAMSSNVGGWLNLRHTGANSGSAV